MLTSCWVTSYRADDVTPLEDWKLLALKFSILLFSLHWWRTPQTARTSSNSSTSSTQVLVLMAVVVRGRAWFTTLNIFMQSKRELWMSSRYYYTEEACGVCLFLISSLLQLLHKMNWILNGSYLEVNIYHRATTDITESHLGVATGSWEGMERWLEEFSHVSLSREVDHISFHLSEILTLEATQRSLLSSHHHIVLKLKIASHINLEIVIKGLLSMYCNTQTHIWTYFIIWEAFCVYT